MDFTQTLILTSKQRKILSKLWNVINEQEKTELIGLLKEEKDNLIQLLTEISKIDPEFLKKFTFLRQKRKKQFLKQIEEQERRITNQEGEEIINKL